jgi:acyl-CoA reductase-like NAD-dependent aldehyde dehydrogenase
VELGGVNVAHVLDDADLVRAANDVANAAFGYAGQKCTATKVVAVASDVADDFAATLAMQTLGVKVGEPLDETAVCGPVIDQDTASRLNDEIEALSAEHTVLARGQAPEGAAFVAPVLLRDGQRTSRLLREELFGPVRVLTSTHSLSDHGEIATSSGAGLCAAIYARDADAIRRALNLVGASVVAVKPIPGSRSAYAVRGWGGSSGGSLSEQGVEGLRFYLKWQTVYWRGEGEGSHFRERPLVTGFRGRPLNPGMSFCRRCYGGKSASVIPVLNVRWFSGRSTATSGLLRADRNAFFAVAQSSPKKFAKRSADRPQLRG